MEWHRTSLIGCGVADCPILPLDNGVKIFRTRLFVCVYSPIYFSREDGSLYREGPCSDTSCPTEANRCVEFRGAVEGVDGMPGSYCGEDTFI